MRVAGVLRLRLIVWGLVVAPWLCVLRAFLVLFFAGHVLAPAGHVGRVVQKHSVTTHRAPMRSSLRLCVVFS